MNEAKADATVRLLEIIPHLRFAIQDANLTGMAKLGVISVKPDQTGRIVAQFEADFIEDLALVLDVPPQSDEDNADAAALKFVTH